MAAPHSPSSDLPPPMPDGSVHPAHQLRQHPLWQQAAGRGARPPAGRGRGRGRGSGGSQAGDDAGGARYERISLLALELQQAACGGDGAESTLMSSDDEEDGGARKGKKRRHKERDDSEDEEEHHYPEDGEEDDEDKLSAVSDDDDEPKSKKKGKKPMRGAERGAQPSAADLMAAAAFGSARPGGRAESLFSDEESAVSCTSSTRRNRAYKEAFPVRGVSCVGCALANRIGPVERFVNANIGRMSETALWKMAALTWKRDVIEPAAREGVEVVDWRWKEVANHFKLHTTNQIIGRTSMIQSLTAMRVQVENCLVRVEDGNRTLDKNNADLFLKIIAADSRERQLLAASTGPGAGRGRSTGAQRQDD